MARIVIADDDADIRELVVFKLRHAGHEVLAGRRRRRRGRGLPRQQVPTWSSST